MTRLLKIILLTATVLILCFGAYVLLTKPAVIEMGDNNDTTEYQPDTSYIYMPVSLSLNGLLEGLNKNLPDQIIDKEVSIGAGSIKITVTRNGDITSRLDSNILRMSLPFKIKLNYKASSNSNSLLNFISTVPMEFNNQVQLAIPVGINQDLNLTGVKDKMKLEWEPLPDLNLPAGNFNLQSILEQQLLGEGGFLYEYIIKETLEKFSLTQYVADAWKKFQIEIPVTGEEEGFLLRSKPVSIVAWYSGGKSDSLYVGLKVGSTFLVRHKSEIINEPAFELPDEIAIENKSHFADTSNFSVKVSLPLTVMDEISTKYLREADLSYKGFKINIDKVHFKNGKNTVYVTIKYSGNLDGEVILQGTPYVNPETRIFSLKNMGLQNKSSNILVTSADRLLNEYLVEKMQDAIHFDLGAAVDSLPTMFQSTLTDLSFDQGVDTQVQQLKLDKIDTYLTRDKIQLIVNGKAKFFVTPKHYHFDIETLQ